jgi:ATP citrate (pro-S)-lyase
MTRGAPRSDGKLLIIGGGIANFTNVASTFKGIIRALKLYQKQLQEHKVKIYVRRGGPNYQEGLKAMRLLGETLGVEIQVFGPETHITEIVPLALGVSKPKTATPASLGVQTNGANGVTPAGSVVPSRAASPTPAGDNSASAAQASTDRNGVVSFDQHTPAAARPWYRPFDASTRALVFGLQPRAIQGMLDFDYACGRETPSVAAMIYPFGGHHVQK